MKNNTNPEQECAGRADVVTAIEENRAEPFLDRTQILRSIHEAYGAGHPVESVMRERMAVVRAGVDPANIRVILPSMEYGSSVYKRRRCGKVASFFRCLLR
ncbi:MAG: hypothetical protein ACI9UA_001055 [Pseudoalteromonas tetraodonis]